MPRSLLVMLVIGALCASTSRGAETFNGWRGNATGLWPEASPPLQWQRIACGATEGMRAAADRPRGDSAGDAPLVEKGLLRRWLVIGPFSVENSTEQFDKDALGGEGDVQPALGDKVDDRTWQLVTVSADDPMEFGTAELPWLDLAKTVGYANNQFVYAHTYIHSPRGGPARIVVGHTHGLKVWLNGKPIYREPDRRLVLGYYPQISRLELDHSTDVSPRIACQLRPGWNRLLLKLSTPSSVGHEEMKCNLRIMDSPDVPYETKNIRWMTELPGRSTSTPILMGGRLFVMAEPDQLLCVDKLTGKILWAEYVNYYTALTPEERHATPAFAEKVDPLFDQLRRESGVLKRAALRKQIDEALREINAEKFTAVYDGHFEAHFGIVGFTMPTPLSDGNRIYVWMGTGIAACFDLGGHRQWIHRVRADELTYGSSPALAEGVLVTFLNRLYGFDAQTGEILWEQPRIQRNVGSVLAAELAGQNVIVTQRGEVIRPKDGKLLFRPRGAASPGDQGWSPPVILGNTMYLPKHGVTELQLYDFSDVNGDQEEWKPTLVKTVNTPPEVSRREDGAWIDRWTAGSPLIHDGIAYQADIWQSVYAVDLAEGKMLYHRQLPLEGFMHYNAVPVAASPTLVRGHVLLMDNQGTTLVLKTGESFKVVARNRIDTVLERFHPLPAQETLAYAPPIVDGDRLYLRGERYLYCIAEDE